MRRFFCALFGHPDSEVMFGAKGRRYLRCACGYESKGVETR